MCVNRNGSGQAAWMHMPVQSLFAYAISILFTCHGPYNKPKKIDLPVFFDFNSWIFTATFKLDLASKLEISRVTTLFFRLVWHTHITHFDYLSLVHDYGIVNWTAFLAIFIHLPYDTVPVGILLPEYLNSTFNYSTFNCCNSLLVYSNLSPKLLFPFHKFSRQFFIYSQIDNYWLYCTLFLTMHVSWSYDFEKKNEKNY